MGIHPMYDYNNAPVHNSLNILRGPGYYDSPEGTSPWEKLWGINKYAIASSLFLTLGDCLIVSETQTFFQSVNVAGFWLMRTCSIATAWASAVYIATDLRGKDDRWNYTIGVAACMPVSYAWWKNCRPMWHLAVAMEVAAMVKKTSIEYGQPLFPKNVPFEYGNSYYANYSLIKTEWPKRPY